MCLDMVQTNKEGFREKVQPVERARVIVKDAQHCCEKTNLSDGRGIKVDMAKVVIILPFPTEVVLFTTVNV